MKKLIICMIGVLMLSGCEDADSKLTKSAYNKMNSTERAMYSTVYENIYTEAYTPLLQEISNRKERLPNYQPPFCDTYGMVRIIERSNRPWTRHNVKYMLTKQEVQGFGQSCNTEDGTNEGSLTPQEEPTYTATTDQNIVIVDNDTILSPKIIDEITEAAEQCFSAKVKMIDIVDGKGYLTTEDYPEVMKLISKCKMNNLRNTIETVK